MYLYEIRITYFEYLRDLNLNFFDERLKKNAKKKVFRYSYTAGLVITLYEISTITLPSEWPFSTFSCASFNLFNGYGHVGSIRGGDKSFS